MVGPFQYPASVYRHIFNFSGEWPPVRKGILHLFSQKEAHSVQSLRLLCLPGFLCKTNNAIFDYYITTATVRSVLPSLVLFSLPWRPQPLPTCLFLLSLTSCFLEYSSFDAGLILETMSMCKYSPNANGLVITTECVTIEVLRVL